MTHMQLDRVAFAWPQRGDRGSDKLVWLGPLPAGESGHLGDDRRLSGSRAVAEPAVALVARDGIQPRPRGVVVPEEGESVDGDDEDVPDGVRGLAGLGEQRPAVGVQGRSVTIIGCSEPGWIVGHDRADHLPVAHGQKVRREPWAVCSFGVNFLAIYSFPARLPRVPIGARPKGLGTPTCAPGEGLTHDAAAVLDHFP